MTTGQLPLELGHRTALAAEDFLVAPSNAEAFAWLERWPGGWPGPTLALFGPSGSGKTHLAHLFAARAGGLILPAWDLDVAAPPRLLAQARALVLEDCDARPLDETALFHLLNLVKESGASLLLTGREAPSRWAVALADLRSRLNALPATGIGAPDDTLLAALLVKLFADRQIRVGKDVLAYLLGRMERSFAACAALVARLDREALRRQRPVTVPLARLILEEDAHGSGTERP